MLARWPDPSETGEFGDNEGDQGRAFDADGSVEAVDAVGDEGAEEA